MNISKEEYKILRRSICPIMVNPYDGEEMLLNKNGHGSYIELEELLILKKKIERSIEFALNNDVVKLNNDEIEEYTKYINSLHRERKKKPRRTNIYLMIDRNTGYHKIGRSKSPTKREATLQSEKPTIELIAHWEGVIKDEKRLHEKYNHKRVRGEWFDLTSEDISEILLQTRVKA